MTDDLKAKLEEASTASGRPVSEEIELRLERTFQDDERAAAERAAGNSMVAPALLKRLRAVLALIELAAPESDDPAPLLASMEVAVTVMARDFFKTDPLTGEQEAQAEALNGIVDSAMRAVLYPNGVPSPVNKLMMLTNTPLRATDILAAPGPSAKARQ